MSEITLESIANLLKTEFDSQLNPVKMNYLQSVKLLILIQ